MKISSCWLRRQIAGGLVMLLAMPLAEAATTPPQQTPTGQQTQSDSKSQNSSGKEAKKEADKSQSVATYPDSPEPVPEQVADQGELSSTSQAGSDQLPNNIQKPLGTAAAPYEKTTGVAASRPAGAVIAPARQRRARSILIRFGVIVGAAVAVGTVVALSQASPSRPN